jgi:hypothetical protein
MVRIVQIWGMHVRRVAYERRKSPKEFSRPVFILNDVRSGIVRGTISVALNRTGVVLSSVNRWRAIFSKKRHENGQEDRQDRRRQRRCSKQTIDWLAGWTTGSGSEAQAALEEESKVRCCTYSSNVRSYGFGKSIRNTRSVLAVSRTTRTTRSCYLSSVSCSPEKPPDAQGLVRSYHPGVRRLAGDQQQQQQQHGMECRRPVHFSVRRGGGLGARIHIHRVNIELRRRAGGPRPGGVVEPTKHAGIVDLGRRIIISSKRTRGEAGAPSICFYVAFHVRLLDRVPGRTQQ